MHIRGGDEDLEHFNGGRNVHEGIRVERHGETNL
jgi:hypothetical protein